MKTPPVEYEKFLAAKVKLAEAWGFHIELDEINPGLRDHNKVMVQWMVAGGRRACFAAFGLHKTVTQLEALRIITEREKCRGLIVCPLGVRQEFKRDALNVLGWNTAPEFIRRIEEADDTGIYLTNYETIRDGKMDPRLFPAGSLDEASILRGFGGSKTFREFMRLYTGDAGPMGDRRGTACVPYRFVATATPSPNDYIELLAYADFLGVMDVSQAKTRYFKRNSTEADNLTLHPHKEREFWLWVSSWALFVSKPSDLGFSDEGYDLPALDVRWHEVESNHGDAGFEKWGQGRMLRDAAIGVSEAASEKRSSLSSRIAKLMELRAEEPDEHRIIWHDLESERLAIEKAIPGIVTAFGSQPLDKREQSIIDFSDGKFQELATKPVIAGSGCNFQRHCARAIYLGIGFKFNDWIQSVHRLQRFLQARPVRIDLIYSEAEREVKKTLERKWRQHEEMVQQMTAIIKEFGLSQAAMAQTLTRKMGVDRVEIIGKNHRLVNWDSVLETRRMETNSVGLSVTSWPFSNQYEYSPNYSDLGHNDNNDEFFAQMDYLTPELFRVLQPGRIYAVHVKDRIVPGGMTGLGFQTVYPFHARCIDHCIKHGFGYLGMKTIVTDVVRENNQTYRLGWTEQCKDGSKMGVGMPEYLLLFRKPPSDTSNSYADVPVLKDKRFWVDPFADLTGNEIEPGHWNNDHGYSRTRWQIDAHGYERSSGNRSLKPEELVALPHSDIFKLFRNHSLTTVYDFEHHVRIGEELERRGRLPTTFMLLQPQSWHDDVWTDITRMLTLNGAQHAKGKEMHLCPLQFDLVDRVIDQMSNAGDVVYDPFSGLGTVPMRAVLKGRFGVGCELSAPYFMDSASYLRAAEEKVGMPTLFDLEEDLAGVAG